MLFGFRIDYLGISSPSVLDMAGYSDTESNHVMASLQFLEEDANGACRAPDVLPPAPPKSSSPIQTQLDLDA